MIKVYKFGIIPRSHQKEVEDIFKISNWFYNDLIQVIRGKQKLYRDITNEGTELLSFKEKYLHQLCEDIDSQIKEARVKSRSKKDDPSLINQLKEAKLVHKKAKQQLTDERKNLKNSFYTTKKYQEIKDLEASIHKNIRSFYTDKYNLYWGTYNLIHEAANMSEKSVFKDRNGCKGFVKFHSYSGEGRLGLQFQKKLDQAEYRSTKNLFIEKSKISNQISISRKSSSYQKGMRHHGKRSQNKAILKFCIATEKSKAILAEFDIILHREIPDGIIKSAVVNKTKVGSKIEWSLDLTIELSDVKSQIKNNKSIAFDLGWRSMGNEKYRIATWKDSDGQSGFFELGVARLNKAEDIQSKVDNHLDLFLPYLQYFVSNYELPSWLEKKKSSLQKTKSKDKLLQLFYFWKNNRFDGDELIFSLLDQWKYRHIHLYNYSSGRKRKFLRNRKQQYLSFAKELSQKYEKVIFENLKLDNMAKGKVAGGQRTKAAPAEFKNAFSYRFYKENIIEISAKNTSKECNNCNSIQELDSSVTQHTCTKCHTSYDRDVNAASNILKKGLSVAASGSVPSELLIALDQENHNQIKGMASS